MNKLLIYTNGSSNRLVYIFDFLLNELLGLQYELTGDKAMFLSSEMPKFSYATQAVNDELFFESNRLLFETKIDVQPIQFSEHDDISGFYPVSDKSLLSFDIFASAFLMLSCYNEYLPNKRDKYDRYRASQSMNFKAGFLEKPMVNNYALALKKILSEKFPNLVFKKNKFEYIATFDVDMAYSYKGKGLAVNLGGFVRSLLTSDFKSAKERYSVLSGKTPDPYDTFDYIFEVCERHRINPLFFFLLADRSSFDKNIPYTNEEFQKLIQQIADKAKTGIHLSYMSHIIKGAMDKEKTRLQNITGQPVISNRFHYLRFTIPTSYPHLLKLGITEDYSLGYAPRIGFRAGTCTPFYFYNLIRDEVTNLKIYPFAFMDTTLSHYNKVDPDTALKRILSIMSTVHEVGGPFIGLWHNSSLSEEGRWKGWKEVFETVAGKAEILMNEQ